MPARLFLTIASATLRSRALADAADDHLGADSPPSSRPFGDLLGRVDWRRRANAVSTVIAGVLKEGRVDDRGQDGTDLDRRPVEQLLTERLRKAASRKLAQPDSSAWRPCAMYCPSGLHQSGGCGMCYDPKMPLVYVVLA
jgi:hypothetical protein